MMTISELKRIVDAVHDLHGPDANAMFVYQRASGRTGIGDITSYRVGVATKGVNYIHFDIAHPRGEVEK